MIPVGQWGSNRPAPPDGEGGHAGPPRHVAGAGRRAVYLSDLVGKQGQRKALQEATDRIMGRVSDELGVLRGETPPALEDRVSDGTKNG